MTTIRIDAERCRTCVPVCPVHISEQSDKGAIPTLLDTAHCLDCGHCIAVCPSDAIEHSGFPAAKLHLLNPELLLSTEQLMARVRSRRSIRAFQNQPVARELRHQVIEAARFAPSAHNSPSTQFIVVQDPAILSPLVTQVVAQMMQWYRWLIHPLIRAGRDAFYVGCVVAASGDRQTPTPAAPAPNLWRIGDRSSQIPLSPLG